jgi:hypothetical protein
MKHPIRLLSSGGLLLALGLAGTGCSSNAKPSATHMQDLDNTVLSSYSSSHPDRLYYMGTEGDYDYYFMQNENKQYKVPRSESLHDPRMPLTDDHSKWQIVPPAAPTE